MQIELLESSQEELAKKNNSNLKVLKMITARARQQELQLEDLESREQEYMQLEEESTQIRQENEQVTDRLERLEEELSRTKQSLSKTTEERDALISGKERLEDVLAAAAMTLQQVSMETAEDEIDTKMRRQTMIERLLLILNSAALLGKAPPPAEFFQQPPKTLMAPLSMVKDVAKTDTSQIPAKEFPHYNLGDLGLVPRPRKLASKQATFASKVAHLSQTTRVGLKPSVTVGKLTPNALQKLDKLPAIVQQNAN
uniref:Cilia- and flagella-associated protein 157 n=1 Tax=Phallusia mammillata TaxID=59560 RepID=A0A6F9D9B1_9ASCI|nr:cilia- and flagella-associated protein 157 [Phallusia mammillata]